jgi:hypothetical protein
MIAQQFVFVPQCIVVPAGVPITFRITSADVVHMLSFLGTNYGLFAVLVAVTMWIHAAGIVMLLRGFMKLYAVPPTRWWPITLMLLRMIWWLLLLHMTEISVWWLFYLWRLVHWLFLRYREPHLSIAARGSHCHLHDSEIGIQPEEN